METIPKPDELLALHDVTAELFDLLKGWFDVPDTLELDLSGIDAVVEQLADPVHVAALAMRKLQALQLLSTPGVRTSTDVVVTIVQDLNRALLQAPAMRLRRDAERTDWDAEFAALVSDGAADEEPAAPTAGDSEDPEVTRFRALHARLHAAAEAVVRASEGQIRILV